MATAYKTPGVYINEIRRFPPSIAPVETAIPAFIGYTQKAQKIKAGDLLNVPMRIGSIAEYEEMFGVGAPLTVTEVKLGNAKNFKSAEVANQFYMYDSLSLFYANGGGDCYIVSAGTYDTAGKTKSDFTGPGKAIETLEKVDEPTILVFPDNSLLPNDADYYAVYVKALDQCEAMMDRVGLFDVKQDERDGKAFRTGIGIKSHLKYGAVYMPWLEANTLKSVTYRSFKDVIKVGASKFSLATLISDPTSDDSKKIKLDLDAYDKVISDVDMINAVSKDLTGIAGKTLTDKFTDLKSAYLATPANKTVANFQIIMDFLYTIAKKVDALVVGNDPLSNNDLKVSIEGLIDSTLKTSYSTLISYDRELAAEVSGYTERLNVQPVPSATQWGGIFVTATAPAASSVITATTVPSQLDQVLPLLEPLFDTINEAWLGGIMGSAQTAEKAKHEGLLGEFPLYKTIVTGIQNTATAVPPCGAVAGIYAYTDRTRGVWKAPANVSLTGIIGPKYTFTASELDALNVDTNSGKSINAIRCFTGKGTLVFGARTLAGNDNEWRYVNVRRFFNFVEESVKKATEQFVFEPNDANTWVKIQAMIENFLTTLWRQGALQGVKPDHAFYVAVGLGKTMTALDILEGRLIVEIGMAALRPAEFIILNFTHKMAES